MGLFPLLYRNRNASGPIQGRPTNNNAEIQAARRAVEIAGSNGVRDLTVRTDSEFLVNSQNKWMPNWERNGWKTTDGRPVKNTQQFQELNSAIRNNNMNVQFEHVRGHSGDKYNTEADRLARNGAQQYRQNRHY